MEPRWISVFIDQPADSFAVGTAFWRSVTGSGLSSRRGAEGEFATLLPAAGDPFCRVQVTADGHAGIHLDLHVADIAAARVEAESAGARVVHDFGHVLLASPGGLVFCLVDDGDERVVPAPVGDPPAALDQICLDIPHDRFDDEVGFWATVLGWARRPVDRPEFQRLSAPPGLPLELLFQRRGDDDPTPTVTAHLDIAAGRHVEAVAAWHESLGATRLADHQPWTVLRDPIGLVYCVTPREPRGA